MKEFSKADLAAFRAYERVRKGGRWNMFDPRARLASGLSQERYVFVMENYDGLLAAVRLETGQERP